MSAFTSLEYLESLNNKELRKKCLEYNLPNVPITDSSRKIILRRLHEAIDPAAVKSKNKKNNRRESNKMQQRHSTNKSTSDSSTSEDNIKENKQNNNKSTRHSIAVITNKQKPNENEMPPPTHPAPKAAKKQPQPQLQQQQQQQQNISHEIEQQQKKPLSYNFNVNQISLQPNTYQPAQEISEQNTFGSYIEDTASSHTNATYNIPTITPHANGFSTAKFLSNAQTNDLETTVPHVTIYNQHNNNYNNTNNNTNNHRRITTTTCIDQFDLDPTTTTTNAANTQPQNQLSLTKPSRLERLTPLSSSGVLTTSYTQEQTPSVKCDTDEEMEFEDSEEFSESEIEFEYDDDDDDNDVDEIETIGAGSRKLNDKNFLPNISTTPISTNNNNNNNIKDTNKLYPNLSALTNDNLNLCANNSYNTPLSYTPTQFTKYKPKRHTTHNSRAFSHADDEVDELVETPFLSEFARKLETLKTEKLTTPSLPKNVITKRNLNVGYVNEIGVTKPLNYGLYEKKPKPRPALETMNSKNILSRYFESLDEKYQIKYYLAAIMAFVLLVFIYVFFFQ